MSVMKPDEDGGPYAYKRKYREESDEDDNDVGDDALDAIGSRAGVALESSDHFSAQDKLSEKFVGDIDGQCHDYSKMVLKEDHKMRPLLVAPDGHVFLESFSPIYQRATDFLVAIAEPVCRPKVIHEYRLTPFSLYAAVSMGLQTADIIMVLERLSKTPLPPGLVKHINECTGNVGKVKMVLRENRYMLESHQPQILQQLLKDPVISNARVTELSTADAPQASDVHVAGMGAKPKTDQGRENTAEVPDDLYASLLAKDEDEDEEERAKAKVHAFEIQREMVEEVKRECLLKLEVPLVEEYDFRNDHYNADLDIDLKASTVLRPFQERSLAKMFSNGRGRSGIIVLPCGAGKTLTGVAIASTVKKRTLVLCTSGVSVEQWADQFKLWSTIRHDNVVRFMSTQKDNFRDVSVTVTTYTMVAHQGQRSRGTQHIMDKLTTTEWGLLLLDEVHVVPANMFRKVLTNVGAHCKVGLTATLVREDDKIVDLNFLIGPKLYEANWMDLQNAGYLAKVKCNEVWCQMTPEFFRKYLEIPGKMRSLLWVMNPNKYRTCQYLCRYHERRGDKVIVFSDNVFALERYACKMGHPFIHGSTGHPERMKVLDSFVRNPAQNVIFISKVGDTSIDLPDANVLIQVSSHFGSRRQEAQRLGRILRAKKNQPKPKEGEYNAFFYSLVSQDTQEMYYSSKRQQFLIEQGYTFEVLQDVMSSDDHIGLGLASESEQRSWLTETLQAIERSGQDVLAEDYDTEVGRRGVVRTKGSMAAASGGGSMLYNEYSVPRPAQKRNILFRDRYHKAK